MKILKATILNVDKKNKNERYFSKQVLDDAMVEFCDKPLYLLNELPSYKDNPLQLIDLEKVIGVGVKSEWLDNNTKLTHTFKLYENKVKDIDFTNMYPAMFGTGNMDADGNITEFNLQGYGLCENPAYETRIEILDTEDKLTI